MEQAGLVAEHVESIHEQREYLVPERVVVKDAFTMKKQLKFSFTAICLVPGSCGHFAEIEIRHWQAVKFDSSRNINSTFRNF